MDYISAVLVFRNSFLFLRVALYFCRPMKQFRLSIIAVFFIFLFEHVQAQTVHISKEQKLNLQSSSIEVIGHVGDRTYTYRASREGYYLDAFNDSMKLVATIALDFLPDKVADIGFVNTTDEIKVVYQAVYGNRLFVFTALLDEAARLKMGPIAIDSVRTNWFATSQKTFQLKGSDDGRQFMIYGLGAAKGEELCLKTMLLTDQLEVASAGERYFSYKLKPQFGRVELANDGTFYFCLFPEREVRFPGNTGWLYCLSATDGQLKSMQMPDMAMSISTPLIKLDQQQQQVYFCAPYALSPRGQVEGLAIGKFTPDADTLNKLMLVAFDQKLRTATDEKNKKRAFNDYDIRDLIIKNDGGVLVVSEKFFYTTRQVYSYGMDGFYSGYYSRSPYFNNSVMEYHYGDILALDITRNGEIAWNAFIRKEQYVQEGHSIKSSYIMMNSGATLVFLFNDFSTAHTSVAMAALSADGSLKLKKLPFVKEMRSELVPLLGRQTGLTEMIIPMVSRNNLSFMRLNF